jgi:hypothetical protein
LQWSISGRSDLGSRSLVPLREPPRQRSQPRRARPHGRIFALDHDPQQWLRPGGTQQAPAPSGHAASTSCQFAAVMRDDRFQGKPLTIGTLISFWGYRRNPPEETFRSPRIPATRPAPGGLQPCRRPWYGGRAPGYARNSRHRTTSPFLEHFNDITITDRCSRKRDIQLASACSSARLVISVPATPLTRAMLRPIPYDRIEQLVAIVELAPGIDHLDAIGIAIEGYAKIGACAMTASQRALGAVAPNPSLIFRPLGWVHDGR